MGYSKEKLLSHLKELQIDFAQYDHPVVLTVEAQAKYVGHLKGALTKNLFLKDKKQRFYIVSALADTKVDLKVLAQRLGLGKGGMRMAPEEALAEVLQVPLGCVTPFALVNESARNVSLLLDQGFKIQDCCLFHPLSNDTSIALNASSLDKFLNSIGKQPAYVDLEANPPVGKDHPPDLGALVPSDGIVLPDTLEKTASSITSEKKHSEKNPIVANTKSSGVAVKTAKATSGLQKEKIANGPEVSRTFTDPEKFVEEILEKTSFVVLSEINDENIKQYGSQLGSVVASSIRKQLTAELENNMTMFKNKAYAAGFHAAAIHHQTKRL